MGRRRNRRVLGVWCNLWSEGVNTHPPLHKLAQLQNPPPWEGHTHRTFMWEAAEKSHKPSKTPKVPPPHDWFLRLHQPCMWHKVMQWIQSAARDSVRGGTWPKCILIHWIHRMLCRPHTTEIRRRGSKGCPWDPWSGDIFLLICFSVTFFLSSQSLFLFLSFSHSFFFYLTFAVT